MRLPQTVVDHYQQFRRWQEASPQVEFKSNDIHHCHNCEHDFTGNFCPYCSQRAGTHRITWETLRQQLMLLWGLDNRSLSYTILQLLLRPGYLIRDYISGRRQVSYPPVKMLFIITIIMAFIEHLYMHETAAIEPATNFPILNTYFKWEQENPGWGMLLNSSIFLLPTWVLFRHAPRYYKHTLPESFFIMVFICSLTQILTFIANITTIKTFILALIYYFITYRQLFGYPIWSTLWRLSLGTVIAAYTGIALFTFAIIITGNAKDFIDTTNQAANEISMAGTYVGTVISMIFITVIPISLLLYIGHRIDRRFHQHA